MTRDLATQLFQVLASGHRNDLEALGQRFDYGKALTPDGARGTEKSDMPHSKKLTRNLGFPRILKRNYGP